MTQGRGIREGQRGSKNPAPLAIYMCLCVCIFGALADEISCLELQVLRRRVEEWLPRNCSRFNLSWLLHSHPCDSGPSSNTGSVTTPSAADTASPQPACRLHGQSPHSKVSAPQVRHLRFAAGGSLAGGTQAWGQAETPGRGPQPMRR